ncbi:Holliday junction resolvase RuvX [Candidatus Poribacteria bacterium]|nr:Holliday junction resolvase RuvX [Candidatus Poribacteria bacterium]
MRILALDIGDVLIGVAVSDPIGIIAQGKDPVERSDIKEDISALKNLISEYEVGRIIVGLPKMLDNRIGIQAQKVMEFTEKLKQAVDIPVILWDERLTTVIANKTLIKANMSRKKRKKVVDNLAATLILQNYLDCQCNLNS